MAMTFLYYTAYSVFQAVGGLGLGTMWVLAQKCGGGNDVVEVRFQRENLPVQSRRPSISADDFAIRSDHFLQFLTFSCSS